MKNENQIEGYVSHSVSRIHEKSIVKGTGKSLSYADLKINKDTNIRFKANKEGVEFDARFNIILSFGACVKSFFSKFWSLVITSYEWLCNQAKRFYNWLISKQVFKALICKLKNLYSKCFKRDDNNESQKSGIDLHKKDRRKEFEKYISKHHKIHFEETKLESELGKISDQINSEFSLQNT